MMKKVLWTLCVVLAGGAAPAALQAQWPGAANPGQGRPGLPPAGGVGRPGPVILPPNFRFQPPAVPGLPDRDKRRDESHPWINAQIITHAIPHAIPSAREEGVIARTFSRGKGGGILGGIGAAVAAAFGALFRRKSAPERRGGGLPRE
jgi:hypothetical protein